jgi:transcription elongation factor GreA
MTQRAVLTQDGYNKLAEELNFLKTKKRQEVAKQLEFARSLGDLRENAEYETAKEAKHQLEIRIADLEHKLSTAKIVDLRDVPKDTVVLGVTVELKNVATGQVIRYTLVPQDEADFNEGKLSITSPIGRGLIGKAPNEIAEIQIPAGKIKYQVLSIS